MNVPINTSNVSGSDGGAPFGPEHTPYEALGGDARVRELVDRFYDLMDEKFAHLRGLHAEDLTNSRLTLYEFLSGWLGGPSLYIQKYGHPRLRMRHAHVSIDDRGVMEWVSCMDEAMNQMGITGPLRAFLNERFAHTARFMQNA